MFTLPLLAGRAVRVMCFTILIALLAVLALADSAYAGEQVPFKARLSGQILSVAPCSDDPALLCQTIVASGQGTHLGQLHAEFHDRIDPATFTFTGTSVLTAANGDTFTTEYEGYAIPTSDPDVITIVVTHTVAGGTGRFSGITGHIDATGLANIVTGTATVHYEGSISSPGSK